MPETTVIPHSDCWVDENKPNTNTPNTPRLRLRSTASGEGKRAFMFPPLPFFPGVGAAVVSAKLYVYAAGAWSGTHTITVKRVVETWSENKTTWNRQPAVSDTNAGTETVSNLSDGDEIEIDLSLMAADSAAGALWLGLRLESDQDTPVRIYSSNNPNAALRPRLVVDWRPRLEAPIPMAPTGGLAVGTATPTLTWQNDKDTNENPQTHSQVQLNTSSDFTSPAYDSGKVANVESQWSLAGEYSLTPSLSYYWRVKAWDDAGQESEWSDVEQFTYTPKGTLTIISPPFTAEGYKELVRSMAPALYWALDDEDGATDLSGNGRDGTGAGGVDIGGDPSDPLDRGGSSTAFDGSDDRVTSSYDPFTNGAARTFTGWGYRDDASGDMTLFGDVGFLSAQASGDVMFSADDASEWDVFAAGLGTGAWFHWALVFDEAEDEAELFIDGVSVDVVEHSAPWASGVFAVGAKSPPNTDPLKGKLAHVAVFERALAPDEVAALADPASLSDGPSGVVEETTPPIVAQLDGAAISQWQVELYRRIDKAGVPWRIEWAKGWVDGAPINVTVPPNIIVSGPTYRVVVRVRDDADRATTPGDPAEYIAEREFYYSRAKSVGPDPVESLTVTPAGPKAVLTWTRTQTPDEFCIRIDGEEVIQGIDPEDVRVNATTYQMDLWRLRPGVEQEVEVEAVVEMGTPLAPYRRHSQNNPTETVKLNTRGVWLVDPDDGTAVMFVDEGSGGNLEMQFREVAETHEPLRSKVPVRVTDVIGGRVGSYSGKLLRMGSEVGVEADTFEDLKRRNKQLRLIVGDLNIPVRLEETSLTPTDEPGHVLWEGSFQFFQSGEVD